MNGTKHAHLFLVILALFSILWIHVLHLYIRALISTVFTRSRLWSTIIQRSASLVFVTFGSPGLIVRYCCLPALNEYAPFMLIIFWSSIRLFIWSILAAARVRVDHVLSVPQMVEREIHDSEIKSHMVIYLILGNIVGMIVSLMFYKGLYP